MIFNLRCKTESEFLFKKCLKLLIPQKFYTNSNRPTKKSVLYIRLDQHTYTFLEFLNQNPWAV